MEPPGRFMKKCTDTGLWRVLSQREAADKTAQAMAYVVRTSRNATKKHSSIPLVSTTCSSLLVPIRHHMQILAWKIVLRRQQHTPMFLEKEQVIWGGDGTQIMI
eukprot:scaffold7649_cov154-Skeletonema_marinoi.AAC.5